MKSRFLLAATGSLFILFSTSVYAQTTLSAAVDYTIKNNPDIATDARYRRSVDEALLGAYSGYLPSVDLGWGIGKEKALNSNTAFRWSDTLTRKEASVALQWNIFQTFGTYFEVERNKARMASAAHQLAGSSEQVALLVVEAYLDVLRMRETVRLTRDNLDNHQKTYDQIQMRAASGIGRKSDLDQAEARLALAKSNLVSAEANLRDVEITFQRYTGMHPDDLFQPDMPGTTLMPTSLENAMEIARLNNPLLKQAIADIEAANAQYNAAKSPFGPRLDIESGMTFNDNTGGMRGPSDDKYAMLRMRWNIFRGGADMARLGETKQLSYQAMEIHKRTLMQLDQSTALSWNTYVSVRERIPSLKQHVESSLLTREAYTLQFSIGQRTLIDLLDTENEYYTATVEYVNGQYLELFAAYRLMADMGRLLESLSVAHLVETVPTERVGWTNPWKRDDFTNPKQQLPLSNAQQKTTATAEEADLVADTDITEENGE